MNNRELPETVRQLIRSSVPTIDALEILVFLVGRDAPITPGALTASVRSAAVSEGVVAEYLALLKANGLVEEENGSYRFAPSGPVLAGAVAELMTAYQQRPVTLIRTVYAIADSRNIQTFADAFRLRRNP